MGDPLSAVASPIVTLVAEKLATLIKEEYLALAGLEKDVENLGTILRDINNVLEKAERGRPEKEVTHLFEELKDAAHDAEDVLDMVSAEALLWNQRQLQQVSCASKWIFRLKHRTIPDEIMKIIETFDSIYQRLSNMDVILKHVTQKSTNQEKNDNPTTTGPVLQANVVGREEEKNRIILEMLMSDTHSVGDRVFWTPIIGMGGIGKTTLAKQVYNDEKVASHFSRKIWINVSDEESKIDHDKILKAIKDVCATDLLQLATLEEEVEHSVKDLKLLIVLDNVWSEEYTDLTNIEKVLRKADKGTRVIVTSRKLSVFGFNPENAQNPYTHLQELPHEDCLALFAKNAFDRDVSTLASIHPDVREIADEIVRKCCGLPLAVEVIGCLLRTKRHEEWSNILSSDLVAFEEDQASIKQHDQRILPILKLSYSNLPATLKQCFSLCSLFPKGHQFDKDELVKLWMAHSLIQPSKSGERLEVKGSEYFDNLRMLSFFRQQPDSEKYRMHDYLHDLAKLVSGKYSCIIRDGNNEIHSHTRHISLICEEVAGTTTTIGNCARLRTFLMPEYFRTLRNFGETLDKIFQTLLHLRVLDLSSSRLSQLPKTIAKLKLLCYLNLSRTDIKCLPNAVCSLRNMQTIKLLECPWFEKLPKNLSRLVKLQHLEIDDAFWKYRCSAQPPNVGRLTCLQNLHKFRVGESKKGSGIEELKDIKDLQGSLHIMELNNAVHAAEANLKDKQRLQVLELEWAIDRDIAQPEGKAVEDHDAQVLEDLEPHSSLVELKVIRYCGKRIPSWLMRGQLQVLKTLFLEGCKNLEALTLGGHPKLQTLCIKNMQKLRELPAELECPSLETLKISNCPQLIQLPESIPELKLLKIKKCSSLKVIPFLAYTGILKLVDNPVLEGFHDNFPVGLFDLGATIWRCTVIGCPNFCGFPAKYNSSKHCINSKLEIGECESICIDPRRALTELMIDTCRKDTFLEAMRVISEFEFKILNDSDVSIHYSQSLTISNISSLISFPTDWVVKLVSLYIWACKDLEALFDSTNSCQQSFPCLVNLSIRDCPKLSKFPEEGLPPNLQLLSIRSCPNVESLGAPGVFKDLHSLADVYIEDCQKLHSFPSQGFPSSLKHLRIKGCPQLTKKCKDESGISHEWPKVMNIPYLEIEAPQASSSQYFSCFQGESSMM